jgi:hypothetical protein
MVFRFTDRVMLTVLAAHLLSPNFSGATSANVWPQGVYKFVTVHQEGFLSSSPRWLSIHIFSKALVGEHRTLSFLYGMAMILTPPCSPDISFAPSLHPHQLAVESISSYKYFRTCGLTWISLSLLLQQHVQFPLLCLPQFGKKIYLLSLKAVGDDWNC